MDPSRIALLAALGILVVLHLQAERTSSRWQWLTKGAASACFVALGIAARSPLPILAALLLAFAGDMLLVPSDPRVFRVGIVVFLLAHVALVVAFVIGRLDWTRVAIALVPLAVAALLIGRALVPRVPKALRAAIVSYMIVISAMVAAAAGRGGWVLAAALAFYANDLLVARERFVTKAFWHRAVGLPVYYGAMAAFVVAG